MPQRPRLSFATKLLAGGLVLSLVLIAGVGSYLLISRSQQTRGAALSNAANRAAVVSQLLLTNTAAPSSQVAQELVSDTGFQTAVGNALADHASGDQAVKQAIQGTRVYQFGDRYVAIITADGRLVASNVRPDLPQPSMSMGTVANALLKRRAAGGVELIGSSNPVAAYDVAIPVIVQASGKLVGCVVYIAPLSIQLINFSTIVQYPLAYIPASRPDFIVRVYPNGTAASAVTYDSPESLRAGVTQQAATVQGTYSAPAGDGSFHDVAGSFVPVAGPASRTPAVYVGVEPPLSEFVGPERTDEVTLGLIAIFALIVTSLLVIVFVQRTVRRPVNVLEKGVARIAGGDYSTDVPVTSEDELGSLARSVNRMRAAISEYVTQIRAQRARLDEAVERLGGVSRALTTTTAGMPALHTAVVGAAASIAGKGAAAVLLVRENDQLSPRVTHAIEGEVSTLQDWNIEADLLAGRAVRVDEVPPGWRAGGMVAVPMFYQEQVIGALAVITRAGHKPVEGDEQALAVLANNAAIALENTRLFEQERDTVRRLRELDAMKSDFLATVQHELRTPLTAILGMSDLLEMCWEMWDDTPKMEAVHDIQVAAKNLYDIVETLIDFSLLESDTLGLNPSRARVRSAVEQAVHQVGERMKGGLPVTVDVDVPEDAEVYADPDRFQQVVRALLDNAVKFTPKGGHVRVLAGKNGNADKLRVDIVDDGIGIPSESLPRIFERFYQVDNSATRKFGGTGMGLALVQRLVQAHGAAVEVESTPGKGTRFSLLWPVHAAAAAGEALAVARERGEFDGDGAAPGM